MTYYLITGGAGFIGSNFVRYLLEIEQDAFIINLDKLTYAGNISNLADIDAKHKDRYKFIIGDICDIELVNSIFEDYSISFVVNFAAESHVDRSILNPNIFVTTNVLGTACLLSAAKASWMKTNNPAARFLQVSTDEVYGSLPEDKPEIKFTEMTPLQPHSPYSASKAGADLLVQSYFDTFGFPSLITRCSNNYGMYQFPEKLIPLMINNALSGKELPVYGDGMNIRDWLFVTDHCSAIYTVIKKGSIGEVYNIGGDNEIKNIDIVNMILDYLGKPKSLIRFIADRPGHDRRYAIDATKIKSQLGWSPEYKFEQQIKETIDWYLSNRSWTENIISGEYLNFYNQNYSGR